MLRRELLQKCLLAGGGVLAAPMLNFGRCRVQAATNQRYSVRAIDLVGESVVVDMLGLLTLDWQRLWGWYRDPASFTAADFERLRTSGITVFHPAVDLNCTDAYAETRRLLGDWNRFLNAQPDTFVRISCCKDFRSAKQSGKIGVLLGMQNSDHFRTPADVAEFYALGQRVSQLTYNAANRIGAGCIEREDRGLTEFGASIVAAMNDAHMLIDVSHAGERTTLETFEISKHPVLITHSNCKALVSHPRCKSDAVIRAMARQGGVMGITSVRTFVRQGQRVTINDALDHFDHVIRLVGAEHAGIGSDMDVEGAASYDIRGLNHPRRIFDLTDGLIRRGYSNDTIRMILGGNFERVIGQVC